VHQRDEPVREVLCESFTSHEQHVERCERGRGTGIGGEHARHRRCALKMRDTMASHELGDVRVRIVKAGR
jgi:hypothetical protein